MVKRLDGLAAVLVDVADAAVGPELPDDRQDNVLRGDALTELAGDLDPADLLFLHGDAASRQHVADLRGPDTERQRAERAVRRRVGVAADDRHTGLGEPLLRPDDVDDPLVAGVGVREVDAGPAEVLLELRHHGLGRLVLERSVAVPGRHDVVDRRVRALRERDLLPALFQHPERLRAGDLVDEVEPDEQLVLSGRQLRHLVAVPHLVVQRPLAHR